MGVEVLFDFATLHGRALGVRIPDGVAEVDALAAAVLAPGERAFAAGLAPARRRSWSGGRIALSEALARAGLPRPSAVLADDRGAPTMAAGVCGSISHKHAVAVALVAPDRGGRIGIDVEIDAEPKYDIARRVLTGDEMRELAQLDPAARARELIVRFSAKEAVYKALDPYVRRFVGFDEVAVTPLPDGRGDVAAGLRHGEGPFAIAVSWRIFEGLVLTTASVRAA